MRSENKIKTMRLARFLARGSVLPFAAVFIDMAVFFAFTYALNVFFNLGRMLSDMERSWQYLGAENLIPHLAKYPVVYIMLFIGMAALNLVFSYQVKTSLGQSELNSGIHGTDRWTTPKEVRMQYKKVPYRDEFFEGEGGTIVQRQGESLFIDDSKSNNLIIGTTRSGKGEMYVVPSIDVYSRAEKLSDRPSMIISDPKLELFKMCKHTLERRGYTVRLLNLDDPYHSMGYSPLELVKNYYRAGEVAKAQMAAKSFSFSVFAADNSTQEPIWKNTATDLYTALIIAVTTDCLEKDRQLNEVRRKNWIRKQNSFRHLSKDEQEIARKTYFRLKEKCEDILQSESIYYIPDEVPFYEVHPNERKVNCFSCLNFFRELCDRKALEDAGSDEERGKIAETALDEYFNSRPPLDYAKALYQEIKTAGDRTKGSVYINMQSALSIFALDSIARLTAENDMDFESLGYGENPVAIFIGIPSEDRSNHFLVTTFISQVYQRLFQLSKTHSGKKQGVLDRKVKFILDEFGNFPEIENFDGFVTVCLGLGISFDIYIQAMNQINAKYKDKEKTIKENFANQIYIKSIGEDTAKEFSSILGKSEEVEVTRSGGRWSLSKNFTEAAKERPLMYPSELAKLKEGECVIYRGIKRTDRLGAAIESHPIINEYADRLSIWEAFMLLWNLFIKRGIKKEPDTHPQEKRTLTFAEEWRIRKSRMLQQNGTALLYRYQYLTDTFPNPDGISLEEINSESRSHVDYTKMVLEPGCALKDALMRKKEKGYLFLHEHEACREICQLLYAADSRWQKELFISEKDTISRITEAVCSGKLSEKEKKEILKLLGGM